MFPSIRYPGTLSYLVYTYPDERHSFIRVAIWGKGFPLLSTTSTLLGMEDGGFLPPEIMIWEGHAGEEGMG